MNLGTGGIVVILVPALYLDVCPLPVVELDTDVKAHLALSGNLHHRLVGHELEFADLAAQDGRDKVLEGGVGVFRIGGEHGLEGIVAEGVKKGGRRGAKCLFFHRDFSVVSRFESLGGMSLSCLHVLCLWGKQKSAFSVYFSHIVIGEKRVFLAMEMENSAKKIQNCHTELFPRGGALYAINIAKRAIFGRRSLSSVSCVLCAFSHGIFRVTIPPIFVTRSFFLGRRTVRD